LASANFFTPADIFVGRPNLSEAPRIFPRYWLTERPSLVAYFAICPLAVKFAADGHFLLEQLHCAEVGEWG